MELLVLSETNSRYVNLGCLVDSWDNLESRLCEKVPSVLFRVDSKTKALWVHFAVIPEVSADFGVDCWPRMKILYQQLKERVSNLSGPGVVNQVRAQHLTERLAVLNRATKGIISEIEMNILSIEIDLVSTELRSVSERLEAIQARHYRAPISAR